MRGKNSLRKVLSSDKRYSADDTEFTDILYKALRHDIKTSIDTVVKVYHEKNISLGDYADALSDVVGERMSHSLIKLNGLEINVYAAANDVDFHIVLSQAINSLGAERSKKYRMYARSPYNELTWLVLSSIRSALSIANDSAFMRQIIGD